MDPKSDLARGVEERMVWEALYPLCLCGESCGHLFETPWVMVATKWWSWSCNSSFQETRVSAVPGKMSAQLWDGACSGFLLVGQGNIPESNTHPPRYLYGQSIPLVFFMQIIALASWSNQKGFISDVWFPLTVLKKKEKGPSACCLFPRVVKKV